MKKLQEGSKRGDGHLRGTARLIPRVSDDERGHINRAEVLDLEIYRLTGRRAKLGQADMMREATFAALKASK